MKALIASCLLFTLFFSSVLYAADTPWQMRQNQEGIPVYTRKVDGSPILEYKANATIDAPISKVIALFEDEKQIRRWYYQCVLSKLVADEGPDKKVIYLILHFPWPVAPRDFIFRRTRSANTPTEVSYYLTALPQDLPPVKGMIRVNSIKSLWTFKAVSKDKTEIFFQQHTDPGGSIPPSIINRICIDTPFYSIKNFRKLLAN